MNNPRISNALASFAHLARSAGGPVAALAEATAEIAELKRKLASKGEDTEPADKPEPDGGDDNPHMPKDKKAKKKAKPIEDSPDEQDDSTSEPEPREPKSATYWSQVFARASHRASPEAILTRVKARGVQPPEGSAMSVNDYQRRVAVTASMVCHVAEIARGRVNPPLPPKGSYARMILEAAAEARGQELEGE